MRRRGRYLWWIAVVLCVPLLAPVLGRTASAERRESTPRISVRNGTTRPVFSYKDAIRETIYIQSAIDDDADPGNDLLATDIIRPKETNQGLRVPIIYEMSPYYQVLGRGNESETKQEEDGDFVPEVFPLFYDNYFVPRGYAVALQDMPGTRNSGGCMVLGGNGELAAAKATMRWFRGEGTAYRINPVTGLREEIGRSDPSHPSNWSTGKAGMIGKSYDGTIANAAASMGLRGLKTIVPIGAISRWYDYHLNRGTQYYNAFLTPELFVFAIDQTPPDDEEAKAEWVRKTFGESAFCEEKGIRIAAEAGDPRADYTAFWDERDYLNDPRSRPDNIDPGVFPSKASKVRASVLIAHGLNDFNVKPNHWVQWWKALGRNGVQRKLWLSQTGHVDPFDFRRKRWVKTLHRWFDRWLHGVNNGIMSEPAVDIERGADTWRTYRSWPAPTAHRVRLFLGPAAKSSKNRRRFPGTLTSDRPGKKKTQSFTDDPNQTESDMVRGRHRSKPNRLLFASKRLSRSVRISGEIPIKLFAKLDRSDTNFTIKLVDYGKARRVDHEGSGEGVRTTDKKSCHGKGTAQDDACYFTTKKRTEVKGIEIVSRGWLDARHRRSLRRSQQLTPGKPYAFRWAAFGEDYVFKRGHRIGVVVAASDSDWTLPEVQSATIDVRLSRSSVVLPVVGSARGIGYQRQ